MQLATSIDDRPWVCSVWFAADDDLNIYWLSSAKRRHSAEVMQNSKVAGTMVLPQTPADKSRGLQFEGIAEVLTEPSDIEKAKTVYKDRIFPLEKIEEFMASSSHPHHFYRIRPTRFVFYDALNSRKFATGVHAVNKAS